eukprot:TRINITY_DN34238_c0_g1_i1.p1 TRINITY_DN34238_c0_g1~~TRINITY_DN34238_c0_g1_i1.p1  ORF type:complete len:774 (+),score=109.64 TRINITY_DN34238_c0_g1_i1:70-2391(+)
MLWLTALFALVLVATLDANVIVFNEGFCDMVLLARSQRAEVKFLRIVHARNVQKLMGYQGGQIDVHLRNGTAALPDAGIIAPEAMLVREIAGSPPLKTFDVPYSGPSSDQPTYLVPDYTQSNYVNFHSFHIPAVGDGWNCTAQVQREPVDFTATLLVLTGCVAVFLGSIAYASWQGRNATETPSRVETMSWTAIVVFFYVHGVRQVYQLSERYMRHTAEAMMKTNKYHGDKVWGLMADTPRISALFGGRRWDRKDIQLRELVDSFNHIAAFAMAYLVVKYTCCKLKGLSRHWITLLLGTGFVCFLHEFTLLLPLSFAILNFVIISLLARLGSPVRGLIPLVAWVLGIGGLALAGGHVTLAILFQPLGPAAEGLGRWLDGFKGELAWTAVFRFWMLHCVSWAVDFYRSLIAAENAVDGPGAHSVVAEADAHGQDEEHQRRENHRAPWEYKSFVMYSAYLFYPPLYMTGPIITFNTFASYMLAPDQEFARGDLIVFWARWFANAVMLVGFGHFLYTTGIMINGPLVSQAEDGHTIFDAILHSGQDGETLCWFSFWSLKWLWFKFLVIWRFARGWALLDGVVPPENMERCMCNNFSVRGFWRGWHRSFNRWLVRYIFVPLGGSRGVSVIQQCASTFVVFTFVAVWHEPNLLHGDRQDLRLLVWGWMFALFVTPELVVERIYRLPVPRGFLKRHPLLTRHLSALGGGCCILLLMLANLVGYSYGLNGAEYLWRAIKRSQKMQLFILAMWFWAAAKTQLMMLIRLREVGSSNEAKKSC